MADTVINSAQVVADYGSFYIDNGQNMNDLKMRPFQEFGTKDAFTIIETDDTILRSANVEVGEVLQGYQDDYTPKGYVGFATGDILLYPVKVDQAFNPTKLVKTWLGFLTSKATDRKTWPFVRWFIQEYVLKQIDDDLEMKAIYNGVYAAPTAGVANNAVDTMNGMKKLINDKITAGKIAPIATGAPSNDPKIWCQQIETFCKALPEKYWDRPLTINMSRVLAQRYMEGRKLLYNVNYSQVADLKAIANFETFNITGRGSMIGAKKIWMTPKSNLVLGVRGFSNTNAVELESVDRKVKIWTDWWMGAGWWMDELMFTNDQDLNPVTP